MPRRGKAPRAKRLAKSVGKSPAWLKTVIIAKPGLVGAARGTFGPASEVVRIDPKTGLPLAEGA